MTGDCHSALLVEGSRPVGKTDELRSVLWSYSGEGESLGALGLGSSGVGDALGDSGVDPELGAEPDSGAGAEGASASGGVSAFGCS